MNPGLLETVAAPIVAFKASLPKRQTEELFDVSQAVPSYGTFAPILAGLKEDLDNRDVGFYTEVEGTLALREALKKHHPLGQAIQPADILITCGANHAMYTALSALCDCKSAKVGGGDTVTLLEPYYFNYKMALDILRLQTDRFVLQPESGFQLPVDTLLGHLEATRPKALILITPNNPTGASYRPSDILTLVEGCAALGTEVLLDETYGPFDPEPLAEPRLGSFLQKNLSLIGSFSKAYSLTGYRVGYWITASDRRQNVLKLQDTMVICAPHISQRAALRGLLNCQAHLDAKVQELGRKAEILRQWNSSQFRARSVGAFFTYLEHPYTELSAREAATRLYVETGILTLPGTIFGPEQDRFLRMAYENLSEDKLRQVLERLS